MNLAGERRVPLGKLVPQVDLVCGAATAKLICQTHSKSAAVVVVIQGR